MGEMQRQTTTEVKKKERKGAKRFLRFLTYGGWLVIVGIIVAIVIAAQSC